MDAQEMASTSSKNSNLIRAKSYVAGWALQIVLTLVTVLVAQVTKGAVTVVVCLVVAMVNALIVLLYFMHLRHEKLLLIKLIMPISVVLLVIFIGLTYIDVITR